MKTTIEKTDGKCDTAQAVQWLNSQLAMKSNGVYELTLQKQTRRRSLDQNRLMWLWFTIIAEQWAEEQERQLIDKLREVLSAHMHGGEIDEVLAELDEKMKGE